MADQLTLITRPKPTQIDSIIIDATIVETHTFDSEITDHPVEEGENVSDHSRPKPDRLQLECIVSNSPITREQQRRVINAGSVRFESVSSSPPARGSPGHAENAYRRLLEIRDNGLLIDVVTRLRSYTSMGIESISIPVTARDSDALHFTVQLKHVRIVRNKLTRTTAARDRRVGAKVKTGNQVTKAPEKPSSALYQGAQTGSESGFEKIRALGRAALRIGGG